MFFANWNFRLTREPRALRRTRGLTTRTDVAVPVRRVQAAILVTGWFRQRFGWHELRLQSLASDGEKERDHQVVPFAQLDAIDPVLERSGDRRAPKATQAWQQSHRIIALGGLVGALGASVGGLVAVSFGQALGWFGPVRRRADRRRVAVRRAFPPLDRPWRTGRDPARDSGNPS